MKRLLILIIMLAFSTAIAHAKSTEEVRLLYYDNTEYLVTDFAFFSNHIAVEGMYFRGTKDQARPLIVKTGNFWQEIVGKEIAKIRLNIDSSKKNLKTEIELKNGKTISGIAALNVEETWETGHYFWIQGTTTKFGQDAKFKINLKEIVLVETIKESGDQIKIKTKNGEEKMAKSIDFGVHGEMPYSNISHYTLDGKVELKSEGVLLSMPLKDVKSFSFDEKGNIKMLTKAGETGKITFSYATKIFGRLNNGDILFHSISSSKGTKLKLIEF